MTIDGFVAIDHARRAAVELDDGLANSLRIGAGHVDTQMPSLGPFVVVKHILRMPCGAMQLQKMIEEGASRLFNEMISQSRRREHRHMHIWKEPDRRAL